MIDYGGSSEVRYGLSRRLDLEPDMLDVSLNGGVVDLTSKTGLRCCNLRLAVTGVSDLVDLFLDLLLCVARDVGSQYDV
jgi:hypothetical protein